MRRIFNIVYNSFPTYDSRIYTIFFAHSSSSSHNIVQSVALKRILTYDAYRYRYDEARSVVFTKYRDVIFVNIILRPFKLPRVFLKLVSKSPAKLLILWKLDAIMKPHSDLLARFLFSRCYSIVSLLWYFPSILCLISLHSNLCRYW